MAASAPVVGEITPPASNTALPPSLRSVAEGSFYQRPPAAVSKNLARLRTEAGLSFRAMQDASGVSDSSLMRMERNYELPVNHPFVPPLVKALAKALRRSQEDIRAELLAGGYEYAFAQDQLERIRRAAGQAGKPRPGAHPTGRAPRSDGQVPRSPRTGKPLSMTPNAIKLRARKAAQNGTAVVGVGTVSPPPTKRASAKITGHDQRQRLRTMVTTYNTRRMQGETMFFAPMTEMHGLLADLLDLAGLPRGLLIEVDFGTTF
jgi:transcriptional regulator with XRE-family HTH domain